MKRLWNKLLDWIVKFKYPIVFDFGITTVAWKWYGGYGILNNDFIVKGEE